MNQTISKSKELSRKIVDVVRETNENYTIFEIIHNLEGFIESYNVKVFYSNMDGFDYPSQISGYSVVNSHGLPEIVVNANDNITRQRFTMAHEFGHIIMHWDWLNAKKGNGLKKQTEVLYRKNDFGLFNSDIREIQANEFAAELLLPHKKLEIVCNDMSKLKNDPIYFEQIRERISEAFNVSKSFATIQLYKIVNEGINNG